MQSPRSRSGPCLSRSLGFATLAGVPVQYGLYSAFAALFAYAIGTSAHVVQGPSGSVAVVLGGHRRAPRRVEGDGHRGRRCDDRSPCDHRPCRVPDARHREAGIGLELLLGSRHGRLRAGLLDRHIIDQSAALLSVPKTSGSYWDELVGTTEQVPEH